MIYGLLSLHLNIPRVIDIRKPAAILLIVLLSAGLNACRETPSVHYDLKVVRLDHGWGYEIRKNNKPFIVQDFIPAVAGKKVFADRKSARKTGLLVLGKLRNNQMPAVTVPELKELGVIAD